MKTETDRTEITDIDNWDGRGDELLSPKQVVEDDEWQGIFSYDTLAHWRVRGIGPDFQKWAQKITYKRRAIRAEIRARTHSSTSEYKAPANAA